MSEPTKDRVAAQCLVCGKDLEPVDPGYVQPHGGLVFRCGGGYGSRIFDPGFHEDRRLIAFVCDECVTERIDRTLIESPVRARPSHTYAAVSSLEDLP